MELILILCLGFIIRFMFLLTGTSDSSDDVVHLWNIQLRQKHANPWDHRVNSISVIPGKRGYPPLAAYIVSLFPRQYWGRAGRFLNIAYDCLVILFCYLLSQNYLFVHAQPQLFVSPSSWVALLIATSPILVPTNSRMRTLGSRSLGFVLVFLQFLSLGGLLYSTSPWATVILFLSSILLGLLIIMSSQFALQVMVSFLILVSGFYVSPWPLFILGGVFVIAFVFPQLGLRDVLEFKWEHLKWYFRNQNEGTTASGRNRLVDHLKLPLYLWVDVRKFFKVIFQDSSVIIALYSLVPLWFTVVSYLFLKMDYHRISSPSINYSLTLIGAACIVFLLTSLPPLLFLGQAERYFEYVTPFVAYVCVLSFVQYHLPATGLFYLLVAQLIFVLANFVACQSEELQKLFSLRPDVKDVIGFLRHRNSSRIITLPTKLSFLLSFSLMEKHQFYFRSINSDKKGFLYLDEDWLKLQYPKPPLRNFKQKYGIDTLVVARQFAKNAVKNLGIDYNFSSYNKIYENHSYQVYEL